MSVSGTAKKVKDEGCWSIWIGLIWFSRWSRHQTWNRECGNPELKENQHPGWFEGGQDELRAAASQGAGVTGKGFGEDEGCSEMQL